jgi:hypothetical protein
VKLDGTSLLPLLEGKVERWQERALFFQWHRGDVPQLYRAFAARTQRYKLVQPEGAGDRQPPSPPVFKLYDMARDPLETSNIAASNPKVVAQLKSEYERWFNDVTAGRDYHHPPRIVLGAPQANPVRLTRQDWRGPLVGWSSQSLGYWEVHVAESGVYEVNARLAGIDQPAVVQLSLGSVRLHQPVPPNAGQVEFKNVRLSAGPGRLECVVELPGTKMGVRDIEVARVH